MNMRWFLSVIVVLLAGCAEKGPVLVRNVKYLVPENSAAAAQKVVVAVSPFKDDRGKIASVLGKMTVRNDVENDLVVQGAVADMVTTAFKEALKSRGVSVRAAPAWDMKAETIAGDGFDILIGGEIKTLWVEVDSQVLTVKEQAEVQLRVSAADRSARTIIKTLNMKSKVEKQEMTFHVDAVEELLSEALTSAIDQLLKDEEFKKKIH